ncbi:MAG: oxygenase MpaB family protein [Chakrabartia godavariana]
MTSSLTDITARVRSQKELLPALYDRFDFDRPPERFADRPEDVTEFRVGSAFPREEMLRDSALVGRFREYTNLGDITGDAYAALMPQYGFRPLVDMLVTACDKGLDAVPNAPPELVALIAEMERVPDWLDMKMVEAGAKEERNSAANLSPFAIRGAFIATFLNKYSALPMALTGTLSHATAARRVKETATFFTTTILPGALERFGPGFKAAAMVRLMHSMVRVNVLSRPGMWDEKTYGVPIPQLDQMPAGLIPIYFLSNDVLKAGRKSFTPAERARVELARYRCYLLGLPEDLLADTPEEIVRIWLTRSATLRHEYDDKICGGLLRATMEAELSTDRSLSGRAFRRLERTFARVFFAKAFLNGDWAAAERVGVKITRRDKFLYAATIAVITFRMAAYAIAGRLPVLGELTDRHLVSKLRRQLASYGHAEFTTDSAQYRPATAAT